MPLLAINHHYYRAAGTGSGIYPTTPAELAGKVEGIRRAGWRLGNQDDILAYIDGGVDGDRVCVVTFDDGLKEQISAVKQLHELGATAICYMPVAPLVEKRVLDVHKLQMIRSVMEDETLAAMLDRDFGFSRHEFDEHVLEIQYRYDGLISRKVKYFLNFTLNADQRNAWVSSLFEARFGNERSAAETLYMNEDELRFLASNGGLGSHGHSHQPLAKLTSKDLRDELHDSADVLEKVSGVRPVGISYPYGGSSAVSDEVFRFASEAGYRYGFTMKRGVNRDLVAPHALRRIDTNDIDKWIN